ncbi:hypothetical protein BDF21DRAFT_405019 [Thamnidium elegans]|nr:hypothetical protein BDF21DRAFT_405019 [Thamnidium elegans]
MRERRLKKYLVEEERYNLPMPKPRRVYSSTTFKPDKGEAIKSRLHNIIKMNLKQNPESDIKDLKKIEEERKKVPRYTYDALDGQYGSYCIHHSLSRLAKITYVSSSIMW